MLQCSWDHHSQVQVKFLLMNMVSLSTVFHSVFVILILAASKGWGIAYASLSYNELWTLIILMIITYITYSGYFIFLNISALQVPEIIAINCLNLMIFCFVVVNTHRVRAFLFIQRRVIYENNI